jgi:hypothetical protein
LINLYSVRSERAFCKELDYHLLFRWFLDMNLIEPGFDATTFTKNRQRLLKHEVAQQLFDEVVVQAGGRRLQPRPDGPAGPTTNRGLRLQPLKPLPRWRATARHPLSSPTV